MGIDSKIDFESLNSAQRSAVECTDGPSLIIAGAGSGKTKVLTYKIAYLLERGVQPSSILALTFTNKASKEMKERISALVGKDKSVRLWMGTFHSIFIRFLRQYADKIGYPASFTVYDSSDSKSAIRVCIKEMQLDEKVYKPSVVQSRISKAKNSLVTASAYMNNAAAIQVDMQSKMGQICEIYKRYEQKCKASGVMDFDDILLNMNILLRDHPDVCEELSRCFRYILVDEYQDTNYAQYLIIKKLSASHRNISVVGDDSQSIYGFRGARIQNILNFRKDYPDSKEFKLEQNYRSTRTIVDAANSVIAKNRNRLPKTCFSQGAAGEKIEVIKAFTEQEEGSLVAASIAKRIYSDKVSYDSFAILYRTNAQSRVVEEMLRKRNLPYKIYAGHSFYERAEVKDLLAYFRLLVNPGDDEAFRRAINTPARGIGETSLKYLADTAKSEGTSLWGALFSDKCEQFGLKAAALNKMRGFANMIQATRVKVDNQDAYSIAVEIVNASGLIASYKQENTIEAQARVENIEELINSVHEFVEEQKAAAEEVGEENVLVTLGSYLENVALISDLEIAEDKKDDGNRISLMTVHSSKGLEFPYVYIIGMEENLFPSVGAVSEADVEEERRLFYVAMTRAEKGLAVSYAGSRFKWGQHTSSPPSRFLKEIDPQYLDRTIDEERKVAVGAGFDDDDAWGNMSGLRDRTFVRRSSGGAGSPSGRVFGGRREETRREPERVVIPRPAMSRPIREADPNFVADPVSSLKVGQRVEHERFGYGVILSIEGAAPNTKAIVRFDVGGEKTLLLKFAKLKIC